MAILSARLIVGVAIRASRACGASKLNRFSGGSGAKKGRGAPNIPICRIEQEFLNRAYDGLEFMRGEARQMLQGVLDLGRGGTFQSRTETTSSCAPASPVSTNWTSATKPSTSAASIASPNRETEGATPKGGHSASRSTSAGSRCPARTTSLWLSTGGRPWPSPFTGSRSGSAGPGQTPAPRRPRPYRPRPGGRVLRRSGGPARRVGWVRRRRRRGGRPARSACCPMGWSSAGPAPCSRRWVRLEPVAWATSWRQSDREQDEIIRAPLPGVLVVQGGPGTGKTTVALHRGVSALYPSVPAGTSGRARRGSQPLVPALHEQVLPSLGETGVSLSTVSGLVSEVRVRGVDDPSVASSRATCGWSRCWPGQCAPASGRSVMTPKSRSAPASSASAPGRPRRSSAWPAAGPEPTTPAGVSWSPRWCGRCPMSTGPGWAGAREGAETPHRRSSAPGPATAARARGHRGARPDVAPLLPHEFLHDLLGARPLLTAAGKGILEPLELQRLTGRAAHRSIRALDGGRRRADRRGEDVARCPPGRPARVRPSAPTRAPPRKRGSGPRAWRPRPRPPSSAGRRRR